jgi:hypothetical protein
MPVPDSDRALTEQVLILPFAMNIAVFCVDERSSDNGMELDSWTYQN